MKQGTLGVVAQPTRQFFRRRSQIDDLVARPRHRLPVEGPQDCAPTGGHFVRPAIFSDVRSESRLAQEEVFSPILAFLPVASFDEAVSVVNDSVYGLSAGIVTQRLDTALRFVNEVEAGVVKINQPTEASAVVSRTPWIGTFTTLVR